MHKSDANGHCNMSFYPIRVALVPFSCPGSGQCSACKSALFPAGAIDDAVIACSCEQHRCLLHVTLEERLSGLIFLMAEFMQHHVERERGYFSPLRIIILAMCTVDRFAGCQCGITGRLSTALIATHIQF